MLLFAAACAHQNTASVVDEQWVEYPIAAPPAVEAVAESPAQAEKHRPNEFMGHLVANRAAQLVGVPLRKAEPSLPDDCTGLVRAAFQSVHVELMNHGERGDSGVMAMWRLANLVHAFEPYEPASPTMPAFFAGDILFFRDTYDRNRDGRFNDGLTHVAVVEEVLPDGTVVYIHRGGSGVARGRLNLASPGIHAMTSNVLNDYLRPPSKLSKPVLGSELFVGVAHAEVLTSVEARQ